MKPKTAHLKVLMFIAMICAGFLFSCIINVILFPNIAIQIKWIIGIAMYFIMWLFYDYTTKDL